MSKPHKLVTTQAAAEPCQSACTEHPLYDAAAWCAQLAPWGSAELRLAKKGNERDGH